ncbi:GrpB family protein [Metabacillus mangrovi]|uniref:GrpB family protein n=1 Tax=Metabacillus mangrovi TaxID=1491830 RepID=UPI0030C7DB3E
MEKYQERWPREFEAEKKALSGALKEDILSIEHIGSTSVPGLAAKPILDIAAGVTDLRAAELYIGPLKEFGYEFVHHPHFPQRRFFRRGEWGAGTHHLHLYVYQSESWNNQILFRDYLRNNSDAMREYERLKVELARKYASDRTAYTEGKGPFVEGILAKAKNVWRTML